MKKIKEKKISLVTGGAGFIGSHIADQLLAMNHKVIILDDLSGGFVRNVNKKAIFIKGSINDNRLVASIFEKYPISYVFHFAAYAAEGLSHFIRKYNYENNLVGSVNLINESIRHEIERFVFASSIAVYGTNRTPMTEELFPMPEDPYGIAKYAIELDLKSAHEMFGMDYTIFRLHNVYGERQNHGDPYRNVIGIFINNIMKGKPMKIFGDGKQTRAFTYIGDVASHIAKSVEMKKTKNEIFNIGSEKPLTVLKLAKAIRKIIGEKAQIEFLLPRNEVMHAFCSHKKIRKVIRFEKSTRLEDGIGKMIAYSKKIGPANPKKFKNIEISRNLPPSWNKLV
jgi:UDP-glucose 4-epimerase